MTPPTQEPRRLSGDDLAAIRERREEAMHESGTVPDSVYRLVASDVPALLDTVAALEAENEQLRSAELNGAEFQRLTCAPAKDLEAQRAHARRAGAVEALEGIAKELENPHPTTIAASVCDDVATAIKARIADLKAAPTKEGQDEVANG